MTRVVYTLASDPQRGTADSRPSHPFVAPGLCFTAGNALVVREGELLADVQEMITAYQALIAQRHRERDGPRWAVAAGGDGAVGGGVRSIP